MAPPTGRIKWAAPLGLVAYLLLIGAALVTSAIHGFPWELLLTVMYVACLAIWLGLARQPLASLGFRRHPGWIGYGLGAVAIAAVLNLVFYAAVVAAGIAVPTRAPGVQDSLIALFLLGPLVALVGNALPEEALFRGFFQRSLTVWLGGGGAILVSALLFSVGHLPTGRAATCLPPDTCWWSSVCSRCSVC